MATKPIEQQVAELTPAQRNNLGKIFVGYLVSLILLIAIGLGVGVGMFLYYDEAADEAEMKMDAIDLEIDLNNRLGIIDTDLYDEQEEYTDEYYDMKEMKSLSLIIAPGIAFVGILVLVLVVKFKFPYFSEKKYNYVKKMEKLQNQ